jgi:hypothetical protein
VPYDYRVSLIWRSLPPWPPYTDPDGHEWKLAPNGFWWLHLNSTGMWYQAGGPAVGDVLGIPVPAFNPAAVALVNENEIRAAFGVPPARGAVTSVTEPAGSWRAPASSNPIPSWMYNGGAGGSSTSNTVVPPPKQLHVVPAPAPNIPPDFAPIPLGEGCCAECHLNDGPLYDGGLCRYCWMLANVPVDAPAARPVVELAPVHPVRDALLPLVKFFLALVVLYYVLGLV